MQKKRRSVVLLCCVISLLFMSALSTSAAQNINSMKVSLNLKTVTVKEFFDAVKKQTNLNFIYNSELAKGVESITIQSDNESVCSVLDKVVGNVGCIYQVDGNIVTVTQQKNGNLRKIIGMVVDEDKLGLPGVNIYVKGTNYHGITDSEGRYTIEIPVEECNLSYSYIGMKPMAIRINKGNANVKKDIILVSDTKIDEVVVTGIVVKNKNSFTGSASTFSGEELKSIGVQNPIASLKSLDPSFNVLDNSLYGSDPNHLPDINIRGKSSLIGLKDEATNDPNQPLFIVDGFESTLETVYNMDINRIASMTILKDAASTAIYGSRAANGVVVVETVKPKAGKLRLSYSGSAAVSMPDLSSYNLMNSSEKLEFEKLAGRYTIDEYNWTADKEILYKNKYNEYLAAINSGVDTYWLSVPLRTGLVHRHNVYVDGGQGAFLYGIGANYSGTTGVMKQSNRKQYGGNLDLIYRLSKLQFQNQFTLSYTESQNPVVTYDKYAKANPYYRKTDENGNITPWLEKSDFAEASNPLYDASLNSRDGSKNLNFTNYLIVEYMPIEDIKLRAKAGITYTSTNDETFESPQASRFDKQDATKKGIFSSSIGKSTTLNGELTAIYAKVLGNHRFTFAAVGKMAESKSLIQGYSAQGFPAGEYTYPSFSNGYPTAEGSTPTYYEAVSRSTNLLGTLNYAFDNRYLMDVNYTLSGSSVFGSNKRFINTWSIGLGWNLMNEKFFKDNIHGVSMLKLRASVGNPGNQDFNSSQSLTVYRFLYNNFNYFGNSTLLQQLGNPNLKWQTTLDCNYGLDLTMFNDRLNVEVNYYNKHTDPLLIKLSTPLSTGVSSTYTNLGKQMDKGLTLSSTYYILRNMKDRVIWSVRATLRHDDIKLDGIGDHLNDLNTSGKNKDTKRYYDGADPDAIWAVHSAGIDPATGRELFIKKDGTYTYDFSIDDEVIVGNTRSKIEGSLGTNFTYKGFTLGLSFGYKLGGKAFNNALYNKVENISGAQLVSNQDRRALYDRWQKPGDIAQFKNIASSSNTPVSSRFVQKNNSLTLESLQIGYDFYNLAKKWGMEGLRLSGYMNDIFWLTTIKQERGTAYPFARSFTFALSFTL